MKYFALLLIAVGFAGSLLAQAPAGFKFQAVARDGSNNALTAENIAVRVSILKGGAAGAVAYSERHEATTTDLGVFDLHIGNGVALSGDMTTVDWGADSHYLKIDVDPAGGTSYVNMGATQLLSVPYAMYATSSGSGGGGGNPTDELQNLIYDPVTQQLTLTDGNSVTLQVGGGGGGSGTDDQQLTLSGTMLSIEDGNSVDLSALQNDADADPTNEIQNLNFNVATNELSIDGGNTVTIPSGGTDADADPTNEIQTISISGNQLTLSDGGGSVELPGGGGGGSDNQTLSFNVATNELSITGGNTVTIPSGGTDADADPTNELQTISVSGTILTLSDGGGDIDIAVAAAPIIAGLDLDDADADPTNEIQTISLAGDKLSLSNGGGMVTLPAGGGGGGTDDQELTLSGTDLSIEDGNSVDLSVLQDGVDDADADPVNEIQTLSLAGDKLSLSNGGGMVTLPAGGGGGGTDDQELTLSGTDLSIEDGNSVDLSVLQDGVDDADADPTNELQTLSLSGTDLKLSNGGGTVSLPVGGTSLWTEAGGDIHRSSGRIGIGTANPESQFRLHIAGHTFIQTNLGDLHFGFPNNGNRWKISTRNQGATFQLGSKPTGAGIYTSHFRLEQDGEAKFGDITGESAWMHVRRNSTVAKPHLKLEEIGNDYARLELTNTAAASSYWHVAGLPSATAANAKLNFYFRNGSGAADRMTITGDGRVGVNTTNPSARLTINQSGQSVGTGLSFRDGTANKDWHVTHGFALRFHYGADLRGFISATTGAYTQSSDERLKKNISDLPRVSARVAKLRPATFQYRDDADDQLTIGLLAQEVQKVFPELVTYSEMDDFYGINYGAFGVVAIKAIQEQQEVIDLQSKEIKSLQARLERLEAAVEALAR